ncbi:MAG TPA: SAM-dependent methyltransferase, partial [Longimicrobiaceae bacterium]|nr:SAM-dependent methyltransferase [Longimicrobiaceae bacterium]
VALISRDPRMAHLVPPLAAETSAWCIEAASPRGCRLVRALDRKWFRSAALALERLALPGITLHYVLRKRYLEDVARQSMQEGVGQVVVLGAGFDALALTLHLQFPEVLCFEIDHPATQRVKRAALAKRRGIPGANLRLISADLSRQTLESCLAGCPEFDPERRTLFIAEGLLMYLAPDEVARLFGSARSCGGPESRFAFTFLERQPDGRPDFRAASRGVGVWLRLQREPFRWGIGWEELPNYLAASGFTLRELAGSETLRRRYLTGTGGSMMLPEGEGICVADRA